MLHDADLPFSDEAAAQWAAASTQERALAYMSMGLADGTLSVSYLRAYLRAPLNRHVSHNALRVMGALNGRINLNTLRHFAPR